MLYNARLHKLTVLPNVYKDKKAFDIMERKGDKKHEQQQSK